MGNREIGFGRVLKWINHRRSILDLRFMVSVLILVLSIEPLAEALRRGGCGRWGKAV